jgi:hypothetical protein
VPLGSGTFVLEVSVESAGKVLQSLPRAATITVAQTPRSSGMIFTDPVVRNA